MALSLGLLGAASPALAIEKAPLCKDLKGLFTPCPQSLNRSGQHKLEQRIEELPPAKAAGSGTVVPTAAHTAPSARAEHPAAAVAPPRSRFERGKLCRDTKGLFTPCAK